MAAIYEIRQIIKNEEIIIGYECDNCGKKINSEKLPNNWYLFGSRHFEWGNDSIDSCEDYYVCSPECYFKLICDKLKKNEGYNSFEINNIPIEFAKKIIEYIEYIKHFGGLKNE